MYSTARQVDRMKGLAELGGQARYMDVTKPETVAAVVSEVSRSTCLLGQGLLLLY